MSLAIRTAVGSRLSLFFGVSMVMLVPLAAAVTWIDDSKPDPARVEAWIEDLGSSTLDAREEAWNKLRGLGSDARAALKSAEEHEDINVRFTVKRLLERLEERDPFASLRRNPSDRALPPRPRAPLGGLDLDDPTAQRFHDEMEAWQSEMDRWFEELLGGRVPGGPQSGQGGRPFGLPLGSGLGGLGIDPNAQGLGSRSSTTVEISPDGSVKVRIKRDQDGDAKEDTYEAPSLEAFRQQYPEVASESGLSGPVGRFGLTPFLRQRVPSGLPAQGESNNGRPWFLPQSGVDPFAIGAGPRLGVQVRVLSEEEPLDTGDQIIERGLLVAEVVPLTMASRVGVRVGDIVVKVGDREIGTPEDVRDALVAYGDSGPVRVTVLRDGTEKVLGGSVQDLKNDRRG